MGFRSMLISEDTSLSVPVWFVDKYENLGYWINKNEKNFSIASMSERKFYGPKHELFTDIQRMIAIADCNPYKIKEVELILFHECGGVEKVTIFEDLIQYTRPDYQPEWIDVAEPSHNYCYGCSDSPVLSLNKERDK